MTSAVLLLAMSASGLGQHSVYASPQAPAKVIPTLQAPTKMPTIPSKVLPFPSKQAPQALPKVLPAPQVPIKAPPKVLSAPQAPLKGYPAPAAFPQAPVKAAPQS
jgi:resuscitation-promoting factor RpfA